MWISEFGIILVSHNRTPSKNRPFDICANSDDTKQHLNPIAVFAVVGLKDTLLPYIYHYGFSNPLPSRATAALSAGQHTLALILLGTLYFMSMTPVKKGAQTVKRQ
jgi:hypothetical protein